MNQLSTVQAPLRISQADNYAGNFGEVYRSSAIFWAKNSDKLQTTIAISNYWKFKNKTEVSVVINVRDLNGKLQNRHRPLFEASEVYNFRPPASFEGSVEIEAFSNKNIRIPYAAVMAVYETDESVSMVHSYARAYAQHEIEDRRTICIGEESCWTLRDSASVFSFCVVHNGAQPQAPQRARLSIRNAQGRERSTEVLLAALAPFQTLVIEARTYFPDIAQWLDGGIGNGRFSFQLNGGFTRMLCAVSTQDESQLQVTHSNFDYSKHQTDKLDDTKAQAFMLTPPAPPGYLQEVVIYPDACPGNYRYRHLGQWCSLEKSVPLRIAVEPGSGADQRFDSEDGALPTRIVTGFRFSSAAGVLPAECSYGIFHHLRPKKHYSWMVASLRLPTRIYWVDAQATIGGCPEEAELVFSLYTEDKLEPAMKKLTKSQLPFANSILLDSLFPDADFAQGGFAYLSAWCAYGGLVFFSSLEKDRSITIEHSF